MKNFNPDRGSRFRGGFDKNRGTRRETVMYKAVCSNCGKACEVPFRPVSGKPVYCKECFSKMGMGGGPTGDRERPVQRDFNTFRGRNERPDRAPERVESRPSNDETKKQLEAMNVKLDKLISLAENILKTKNTAAPETVSEVRVRPAEEKESLNKAVKKAIKKPKKK
jgi:CxxC-x17-CxxC domain-containing protein